VRFFEKLQRKGGKEGPFNSLPDALRGINLLEFARTVGKSVEGGSASGEN